MMLFPPPHSHDGGDGPSLSNRDGVVIIITVIIAVPLYAFIFCFLLFDLEAVVEETYGYLVILSAVCLWMTASVGTVVLTIVVFCDV
jgi:hypothetical protein